jgi:hypothetical protein
MNPFGPHTYKCTSKPWAARKASRLRVNELHHFVEDGEVDALALQCKLGSQASGNARTLAAS